MSTSQEISVSSLSAQARARTVNPWFIAGTVTIAAFMELLDTSIANVALPYIGAAWGGATTR